MAEDKKKAELPALPAEDDFHEVEGSELPDFGVFYTWEHPGEVLKGTLVSKRINPAREGRDGSKFKEQTLWDVSGANGELWTLNGNFDLDSKLKKIRMGNRVRITYKEDKEVGPGLSDMRIFKVETAPPLKK